LSRSRGQGSEGRESWQPFRMRFSEPLKNLLFHRLADRRGPEISPPAPASKPVAREGSYVRYYHTIVRFGHSFLGLRLTPHLWQPCLDLPSPPSSLSDAIPPKALARISRKVMHIHAQDCSKLASDLLFGHRITLGGWGTKVSARA
jgi:hypothetical protein